MVTKLATATDVTFRTLEIAEALQSKTLFSHGRPVGGRAGHRLIWEQWFDKWKAGGKREKERYGQEKKKTKQKKRGPKQKGRERGAMEMRVMKKRRKTFQSTLTNTHSARCSSVRDTCQKITFVSGRRRGVDLRRRALLLLFLLVFLTAATKGTGEREEDDAAL